MADDDLRREIARRQYAGVPQDPTGTDRSSTGSELMNDQTESQGDRGLEGGASGKFTRPFRRDDEESGIPAPGRRSGS